MKAGDFSLLSFWQDFSSTLSSDIICIIHRGKVCQAKAEVSWDVDTAMGVCVRVCLSYLSS